MNRVVAIGLAMGWFARAALGAVPPAQNLLPDDTLAVLTVPDAARARASFARSAPAQLWNDPAMKPFREKFSAGWMHQVLGPLESEWKINLADYLDLAQGQFTLAWIRNGWNGDPHSQPARVFLLDTGTKSNQLTTNLTRLRQQWAASGSPTHIEKIRDVEFSVLALSPDANAVLNRVFGDTNAGPGFAGEAVRKPDLYVGQSGPLLLAGDDVKPLERILARLAGSPTPTLGDQAAFELAQNGLLRDALAFGWLDAKGILGTIGEQSARETAEDEGPFLFPPAHVLFSAFGLTSLKTAAFSLRGEDNGTRLQFYFRAPAQERAGLLKLLAVEAKDATPPAFVPADAVKFRRIRADLPAAWAELESMLEKFAPDQVGSIRKAMDDVGKDVDPAFDFRKTLLAGLGDDIITYEKLPPDRSMAGLDSGPGLTLLGARDADQLLLAVRALTALMPPHLGGGSEVKEREFLGRKIFSLTPEAAPAAGSASGDGGLHFAVSGGYLALSTSPALLEEYLRSPESSGKPLRDTLGLLDAAQQVGGPGTGLFGFADLAEQLRVAFEALRSDPQHGSPLRFTSGTPLDALAGPPKTIPWADFSLLPEFPRVAKYFGFLVHGGSASDDGLSLNFFAPRPPGLGPP